MIVSILCLPARPVWLRALIRTGPLVILLVLSGAGELPAHAAQAPRVAVSILPVHSLVAAIMAGASEPALLVDAGVSPHGFALRPSQMSVIEESVLLIRVGQGLDDFLERPIAARGNDLRVLGVMAIPGIALRRRARSDEAPGVDAHGRFDPHIWLDPTNARAIVTAVTAELFRLDPANGELYRTNAAALDTRLVALDNDIRALLAPFGQRPFIVVHDAYGYLAAAYGLTGGLVLTSDPEHMPGARRIAQLRETIMEMDVRCVFAEPHFPEGLIDTLIEGTDARSARLDPLGAGLAPGPAAYFSVMRAMAESMASCVAE